MTTDEIMNRSYNEDIKSVDAVTPIVTGYAVQE